MEDNGADEVEFDLVPYCECGKENPLKCNAEVCAAEWIPVIYIDPDWPNETKEG